jgi:hypothetical protein
MELVITGLFLVILLALLPYIIALIWEVIGIAVRLLISIILTLFEVCILDPIRRSTESARRKKQEALDDAESAEYFLQLKKERDAEDAWRKANPAEYKRQLEARIELEEEKREIEEKWQMDHPEENDPLFYGTMKSRKPVSRSSTKLSHAARLAIPYDKTKSGSPKVRAVTHASTTGYVYSASDRRAIPIAVIQDGSITKGHTFYYNIIVGVRKGESAYMPLGRSPFPVATYSPGSQSLYRGAYKSGVALAVVLSVAGSGDRYQIRASRIGEVLGYYRGPEAEIPLAAAFLLGLLD